MSLQKTTFDDLAMVTCTECGEEMFAVAREFHRCTPARKEFDALKERVEKLEKMMSELPPAKDLGNGCDTVETWLGRHVFRDDWKEFQGDVVLKMLYDNASVLGGQFDHDYRLSQERIYTASAMSRDEVSEVVAHLSARGLVKANNEDVYLTNLGYSFVHTRPWDKEI